MQRSLLLTLLLSFALGCGPDALPDGQVRTAQGIVDGTSSKVEGVRAYLGIPFAAPPERWKAPTPPAKWEGVRAADAFGNRCIQTNPWPDMLWNSAAESEDCLYAAIWAPADAENLPVMVWIHGGGYLSGSGGEKRHDGSVLASKGVVLVTINYRLGLLGFMAHPGLTAEAGASGNYGLLDQIAALEWVRDNIAGFGGDPDRVTIFGESAGSFAVSALMASPLADGLFQRAIGQSGAHIQSGTLGMAPLSSAETQGLAIASAAEAKSVTGLRNMDAALLASLGAQKGIRFGPNVDGHVLPTDPTAVFEEGAQSRVPLMAGWTSSEIKGWSPSVEEFQAALRMQYPDDFDRALEVYPAGSAAEAKRAAATLAGDNFLVFSTWKWMQLHAASSEQPIYRYVFDQVMATPDGPVPDDDTGAAHATDIYFTFDTMESTGNPISAADSLTAAAMTSYWTNFARNGNPNGEGLPNWPEWSAERKVMRLNETPAAEPETDLARFEFLDDFAGRQP